MTVRHGVIALAILMNAGIGQAQRVLADGIRELAGEIGASAAKSEKHRIAVVAFQELDGRKTVLGGFLAEELTTGLFKVGGLEIVERSMLDKIFAELKLSGTGAVDVETAKKVGKLAGVEAIVTGTVTDLQSYVALNCRMIDTETGRLFAAAQARIVKDDDLRKIMGSSRGCRAFEP